jgi:formylglycine-generating enzyme required for sulfatase activity
MSRVEEAVEPSRLIPLSIAGVVCFVLAVILGYGGWYLFGTHDRSSASSVSEVKQTPSVPVTATPQQTPASTAPPIITAPAGELPVPEGEVVLGGDKTGLPVRREFVNPFAIAETEVTNEQYHEFVKATGHRVPAQWKDGEFPPGSATEPITGVTWQDATDYCSWLSEQIKAQVRLPTEAEWEWAARGREGYKYPWGNEWNERAVASEEMKGRMRAVKSYPAGRSPVGAYDMAGNVWEWVADEARDADGNPVIKKGVTSRIAKGGAATEPAAYISGTSRQEVPGDAADASLGFRYVVVRANKNAEQKSQ